MDVDTLDPGVDFVEPMEEVLGACDVLIAVSAAVGWPHPGGAPAQDRGRQAGGISMSVTRRGEDRRGRSGLSKQFATFG